MFFLLNFLSVPNPWEVLKNIGLTPAEVQFPSSKKCCFSARCVTSSHQELRQGSSCWWCLISVAITVLAQSTAVLGRSQWQHCVLGRRFCSERECLHLCIEPLPFQNLSPCLLRIIRFHVAKHKASVVVFTRGAVFSCGGFAGLCEIPSSSESWSCFTGVAKVIWWEGNALVICCCLQENMNKILPPEQG